MYYLPPLDEEHGLIVDERTDEEVWKEWDRIVEQLGKYSDDEYENLGNTGRTG